jgi:hypothetical protein
MYFVRASRLWFRARAAEADFEGYVAQAEAMA